jgi:hypothetical protein
MSCICRVFFCCYLQCVDCSVAVFETLDVFVADDLQVEMSTGTRNPSTRWVLPDKEAGMGRIFYPWVRY